jgi:hypothetical protein
MNKKKISFSDDTKTYDGSCERTQKYGKLILKFFNNKNINFYDILTISGNIDYINDFIVETEILKNKLKDIEIEEEIEECFKPPLKPIGEHDPYWDSIDFVEAAYNRQYSKKGFCISRYGSRDYNQKLYPKHIEQLDDFIKLLDNTKNNCVFL